MARFGDPEDYDEDGEDEAADDEENDEPAFEENLVFVIMPFHGQDSDEVYSAIKGACAKHWLKGKTSERQRRICADHK
jgi:hypothetical protein